MNKPLSRAEQSQQQAASAKKKREEDEAALKREQEAVRAKEDADAKQQAATELPKILERCHRLIDEAAQQEKRDVLIPFSDRFCSGKVSVLTRERLDVAAKALTAEGYIVEQECRNIDNQKTDVDGFPEGPEIWNHVARLNVSWKPPEAK